MQDNQQPLRHIVLFKLYEGISQEKEAKAVQLLKQLGEDSDDILSWKIEKSLDTRKGMIIVENGLFKNANALEAFRLSEKHAHVSAFMKQIAHWLAGDYKET